MTTPSPAEQAARRKRLGQYFTGDRLARVLAGLARATDARRVIDPMAGSGDMLAACRALGARPGAQAAVEIDPQQAEICRARFQDQSPPLTLVRGDAFDPASWADLGGAWDLVITNPPYVRYQLGSAGAEDEISIPGAEQVRRSLLECLARAENLGRDERAGFLRCAERYSGLADLAVPSWLLCGARVAVGGRLAVVVPNTWLSRDYAAPVLYVLRRFFDIEYVVEDADMAWFSDVIPRTMLVVARRVEDRGSALGAGGHLFMSLPASVASEASLVGQLYPRSDRPEQDFADWAARQMSARGRGDRRGVRHAWSDERDLVQALRHAARSQAWIAGGEPASTPGPSVPERLRELLPQEPPNLGSLADLGWTTGQGLRTGANDFFYVSRAAGGAGVCSPLLPGATLQLPQEALRPAVRRQSELPVDSRRTPVERAVSLALVLEDWALPGDIKRARGPRPWRAMKGDLARLVRAATARTYRRREAQVPLPQLTAVRTNVREGADDPPRPARFWYQLPPLAPRHRPALYIARVVAGHPVPYLNARPPLVVDANFSALWPTAAEAVPARVLLALLSSSWVAAFLEATGTALGGGALKVEATHLRRLLLPVPDGAAQRELAELADVLLDRPSDSEVRGSIDDVVFELLGCSAAREAVARFAADRLAARSG